MTGKEEVRASLKNERRLITKDEVVQRSRGIEKNLFTIEELLSAKTVMIYSASFNEPRSLRIMKRLFDMGKRVIMPVTRTENREIIPSECFEDDDYRVGPYGIPEPQIIRPVEKSVIDAALIPGLGFDVRGSRMGFGGGYYDRFLEDFDGLKIGVCYEFQLLDEIPTVKTDVPMDIIVTESGITNVI